MASKEDLTLAKRLMAAGVLTEDTVRAAFEQQEDLRAKGRSFTIERIFYARKDLPPGCLEVLRAPSLFDSQPLSNYRIEEVLGEGGSGTVYGGVYLPNGAPVAIKVLDPIHALRPEFLKRFQHEAQLLVELDHENIVMGYENGLESGYHYFSMDRIDGMTVLEVIDRRGHLENEEALSITLQTARALDYLHGSGFLHRDVKPSNMMIEPDGRVRMIDLGLVRRMDEGPESPEEETMTVGTVEYLSPEQARGRSDLDPRTDIYSLGLSLYHMAVGDVPFHGETDYEVMAKQIMASLDTQKMKKRRISPEIHFFIVKMTSKDRDNRYESVGEVCEDIVGYVPEAWVPVDFGPDPMGFDDVPPPVVAPIGAQPPVAPPVAPPIAPPVAPVARPAQPPVAPPVAPPIAPVAPPVAPPVRSQPPKAPPVAPPIAPPTAPPVAPPIAPPTGPETPPPAPTPAPTKRKGGPPVRRRRRR